MIVCAFSVSHTSELSASEANLAVSACPLRDRLWSVPPLIQLSISKILFRVLCRQGVINVIIVVVLVVCICLHFRGGIDLFRLPYLVLLKFFETYSTPQNLSAI